MGHPGYAETYRNIATYYTWPSMKAQITAYVQNACCVAAQKRTTGITNLRNDRDGLLDHGKPWIEAYPLPHGDANTIGRTMDTHLFPRWGYPKILLSDNGTQFTGKLWNELCLKWGVLHYTTPIYHPRANPTERRNQELKKGLRIRLQEQHQEWENQLPSVLFTLRNRQNTEGDPIAETQPRYQIGDQVLTRNHQLSNKAQKFHAGLAPRWKGPYTVAHNQGAVYWITRDNETIKVYETQLRPAPTIDQQHLLE
ncbi:uncharacterized protein LOC120355154 [Nilaparvata lugens]|uniref:uncharacterized protein LOC120355154 n=1 Tax=Nilaparvata lugens TaxID=108931 RepID=UPI00193DD931|nr:uncharacterized protein LOC120355154 [Nilaparvata lugens]